jgi:hypothetical protein
MKNRDLYKFDDFTENEYRNCIKIAKQNYQFIKYTDDLDGDRICLWRHDIDYAPQRALELAKIEQSEGITSTFFVLLHSEWYSPLEISVFQEIKNIRECGHDIGLHFDYAFYQNRIHSLSDFEFFLSLEKEFLEKIFGVEIFSYSLHNPSLLNDVKLNSNDYCGMINVYGEKISENFAYLSDSFCIWKYHRLKDFLEEAKENRIQILTHPICWTKEVLSPHQRFLSIVEERKNKSIKIYLEQSVLANRETIED